MAIREDLVASAATFLQDPTVSASPVDSIIAFLQAKNLTQEEVQAALARAATDSGAARPVPGAPPPSAQQQPYFGSPYPPQYPPYAWQPAPPEPGRDWRDWFIMATVVGSIGYGIFSLGKHYIYPLIAPPTPDRLEQDKKSVDEQFEKTFALVEQLAKDTETLKAAEKARTERLDSALTELETVMNELKLANRRRDDDTQRMRDDVKGLKDAIPRAQAAQKDAVDGRMRELNLELKSLKSLLSQRLEQPRHYGGASTIGGGATFSESVSSSRVQRPTNASPFESSATNGESENDQGDAGRGMESSSTATDEALKRAEAPNPPSFGPDGSKTSPFCSVKPQGRASIPAWQLAMSNRAGDSSSSEPKPANGAAESSDSVIDSKAAA